MTGQRWQTTIGGHEVLVQMPIHGQSSRDETGLSPLVNPTANDTLNVVNGWGYTDQHVCEVLAVALSSASDVDEDAARSIYEGVDAWLECIFAWLSAWTGQAIHTRDDVPVQGGISTDLRIWSRDVEGREAKIRRPISIKMLPGVPASAFQLADAMDRSARLECPPLEHQFYTNALVALLRRDYRRAVIDATTAVDVVVGQVCETIKRKTKNEELQDRLDKTKLLGKRIELARKNGANLPAELHGTLLEPRNAAVHHGTTPTRDTARAALRLSRNVIDLHSALDRPTQRP